ncbi:hypothetical protein ACIP93_25270 [Streptomyces sp. NPDC088745]|uniref:hypothetical protein n=1 Tax=Streptomyces sp. NPDC088745 TaxID=3365884 RepID=UPI00381CA1D6
MSQRTALILFMTVVFGTGVLTFITVGKSHPSSPKAVLAGSIAAGTRTAGLHNLPGPGVAARASARKQERQVPPAFRGSMGTALVIPESWWPSRHRRFTQRALP